MFCEGYSVTIPACQQTGIADVFFLQARLYEKEKRLWHIMVSIMVP
jgi:hypothetical protein